MRRALIPAAAFLLTLASAVPGHAAEPCAWGAPLPEAETAEGYRVSVIFSSFDGQTVNLQVSDLPGLERVLTTEEWSAALSGAIQCRLRGRTHFNLTVDDVTTSLYIDVDGPLQIYFSPSRSGPTIALWETGSSVYLLD